MGKCYPLVEATCQDCGRIVMITSNSSGRLKRCKECNKINKRKRWRKYDARKREERMQLQPTRNISDSSIGGEYHIARDPDRSWGFDSSFTYDEIVRMLSMKYLTPGTEFALEPSKDATHRIINVHGVCLMRLISEIEPAKTPQAQEQKRPKPKLKVYWRTKKLCRSMTA